MTADWTTCRVVRDRGGDLWGRGAADPDPNTLARWFRLSDGDHYLEYALERFRGPLDPVLDADGQAAVTTVGDLTLRQVRHRPQILLRVGEDVGTLYVAPSGEYALLVLNGQPMGRLQPVTLDTPCEVLP